MDWVRQRDGQLVRTARLVHASRRRGTVPACRYRRLPPTFSCYICRVPAEAELQQRVHAA